MTGPEWTSGYVSDVAYTFGYYTELNPVRARLAFLNSGLAFPEIRTACELGFGQGVSVNIHAAASSVEWHGTDFNPSQAAFARELAAAGGTGARLHDEAFADFSQRQDLPAFDYIGLHGIWSWISDANRAVIADFIRRKLRPGGVLYISYNTLPGWAAFAPMRHLLTQHAEVIGAKGGGTVDRIDGALDFADRLLATNPGFARANPQVAERLKGLRGQDKHYLAHEYFNRDWHPMHFSAMAEWLSPAKVSYACSATPLDLIDALNLFPEQLALLGEVPDPTLRELIRDFMVNQQFRRDYWVKGPRRLTGLAQLEGLQAEKVVLLTPRADVSLKVAGSLGETSMNAELCNPVLDFIADHKPRTLGEISQSLGINPPIGQLVAAILMLISGGHLAGAQDDEAAEKAKPKTDRLNAYIQAKARGGGDIAYLASPVTGGGVMVPRFTQMFLTAKAAGRETPRDLADHVWQLLSAQGQRLVKDNAMLQTPEENLAALTAQAELCEAKTFPALRGLGIGASVPA